jgi:hypothetical protein
LLDLRLTLPIASIEDLGEVSEFDNSLWLPDSRDFILEAVGEGVIHPSDQRRFAPFDARGEVVELRKEFGDSSTILHGEVVEFIFGVRGGVVRTEIVQEFGFELSPIFQPKGFLIEFSEVPWLEPVKRSPLDVGDGEIDFGGVFLERSGTVLEV